MVVDGINVRDFVLLFQEADSLEAVNHLTGELKTRTITGDAQRILEAAYRQALARVSETEEAQNNYPFITPSERRIV